MYTNKHLEQLASLNHRITFIQQDIQKKQSDLKWFSGFNHEHAYSDLCDRNRNLQGIRLRLDEFTTKINSYKQQMNTHRSNASGFLSSIWRTSKQVVAQRHADEIEGRLQPLLQAKNEAEAELIYHEKTKRQLEADLCQYKQIDPLAVEASIAGLSFELTRFQEQVEQTRILSDRWESTAGELVRCLKTSQGKLMELQRRIDKAKNYQEQLSGATNPCEKAKIHQLCESDLDEGSPGRAIANLSAEHRKLARDTEKLGDRVRDVIRRLEVPIKTLIIDGSNLCYALGENGKSEFIGLNPLKALVTYLTSEYKVSLFFDSGIRSQLTITESSLQAIFPTATVTVMTNANTKADEVILGAAEFDKHAYIVSNDDYAKDYFEKFPVQERRRFTHFIHKSSVQIPELNVNIPY